VLPQPQPSQPWTRTTTLGELAGGGPAARAVAAALRRIASSRVRAADLDTAEDMVVAGIAEMPLRGFVQFSGGMLPMRALDRLLAVLNGDLLGRSRNAGGPAGNTRV
jgi:hypothetical protein